MAAIVQDAHSCVLVGHIEQEAAGIVVAHFIRADNGVLVAVIEHFADFGYCEGGCCLHGACVLVATNISVYTYLIFS